MMIPKSTDVISEIQQVLQQVGVSLGTSSVLGYEVSTEVLPNGERTIRITVRLLTP